MNLVRRFLLNLSLILIVSTSTALCSSKEKTGESQTNKPWQNIFLKWNKELGNNSGVGVVRSIQINPENNTSVLAGALLAGVWQSNDAGENWKLVSGGVPEVTYVNDIQFSREDANVVYAGTNVGVIKSLNGGKDWQYTNLNIAAKFPQSYGKYIWLGMAKTSNLVYVTITENGTNKLYKTTDGGENWQSVYQTKQRIWDMRIKPDDENIVYLLEQSSKTKWINFLKSEDGGKTFEVICEGYPCDYDTKVHRARIAVTPANNDVVYISTGFNGGGKNDKISFFRSDDAGASFVKMNGQLTKPLVHESGPKDFLYETCHLAQLSWNFAFTASETDENFIACAANKIKVSTDGGKTWQYDLSGSIVKGREYDRYPSAKSHSGVHGDHHGLAIIGKHIWNANDGGVYYSADGGYTVVKDKTDGMGIQELWGFGQAFKKDVMAVGLNHNQICFYDEKAYGGWIGFNGADAMAANVNPIDDVFMYTHPWGHEKVERNLKGIRGHKTQKLGIELGYITLDNLEFHPHHYYTIYGADYGDRNKTYKLAKTTDNAETWEHIASFEEDKANVVSVKVSFADANYVYAVVQPNRVIKSTDEGKIWTEISPPSSLIQNMKLWRMAVSDTNPKHVWVTVKGHQNQLKVIHTQDGGETWKDYSQGLPLFEIFSMIYQRGSDDLLYLGTTHGVFYRKKGMSQWAKLGTGLPAAQVSFIHINYAKSKLRIGTNRGIWQIDLYEKTAPKANISANQLVIDKNVDPKVQFADYSVVLEGASFKWQFPGAEPKTSTEERPVVSYENAKPGYYDVTLEVKDEMGKSTQSLKGFIEVK